jgi:flagellar biosynthetic protein FliQ
MGADMAAELGRRLLVEAMMLGAPFLVAACLVSVGLSVVQTLTGVQEQTLTTVPRLLTVFALGLAAMPWLAHRLTDYTVRLWTDLHRYLG